MTVCVRVGGGGSQIEDPCTPNPQTPRLVCASWWASCLIPSPPLPLPLHHVRWGKKPDGVCIVVGTLASNFRNNNTGDIIYTLTDLQPDTAAVSR